MNVVRQRILIYARADDHLPATLAETSALENKIASLDDGWGRPLVYTFSPSGNVTLTSLGRDGKRGGVGDDADIIRTFPSRDGLGHWSGDDQGFIEDKLADKPTIIPPHPGPTQ